MTHEKMPTDPNATKNPLHRQYAPLGIVLTGFLTLMFWHVGRLLEKPHYQFLWILPVAAFLLFMSTEEGDRDPAVRPSEKAAGFGILTAAFAALAIATWKWSPFIAACGLLPAVTGGVLLCGGWRAVQRYYPLILLCLILIPLPLGMDEDLIVELRGLTTRQASSVLDQLGVMHNSYANVVELPQKPLFIADACSGIHSLYVLIAAALIVALWNRRGILHSVLLLGCTFGIVLIENVARIVTVAAALQWRMDLSEGWEHELLGVLLFIVSLGLVLSADQFLRFVMPDKLPSPVNWAFAKLTGDDSNRSRSGRPQTAQTGSAGQNLVTAAVSVFPLMAVIGLFTAPAGAPDFTSAFQSDYEMDDLGEDALPAAIGNFRRTDYRKVSRVPGDPLGRSSEQWYYRNGSISAMISMDYPYDGVHDLCLCYSQIGWKLGDRKVIPQSEMTQVFSGANGPVAVGFMKRELYGTAMLAFNLTNLAGRTSAVIKDLARGSVGERAERRAEAADGVQADVQNEEKSGRTDTWIQCQLLAQSPDEFGESEVAELLLLFSECEQHVRSAVLASESASGN